MHPTARDCERVVDRATLPGFGRPCQESRAVPDPSTPVFVRRGATVQGPVPFSRVVSLLKAGTLRPTDEFATTASGPWTPLGTAVVGGRSELPIVDSVTIKRAVFGGYVAHYPCPKCGDALQSSEEEMSQVETCPTCGVRYRLSSRATQQVGEAKLEHERQRAAQAAAAERERERKASERQKAVARREEERHRQADAKRQQDADLATAERLSVDRAARARARPGSCWYCGCPDIGRLPQCPACRLPGGVGGSRRVSG